MAVGGVGSIGTQVNRHLDALGLPDAYGDKIGAMVDLQRGDMAGFYRNVADLNSGLTTRQMDRISGQGGNVMFARGYIGRCHYSGPHLHRWTSTYATHERVGKQAHVGQKYTKGRFLFFKLKGRISGRMYRGSFHRPIRLGKSGYLYHGRMYKNMGAIHKDMRDGRVDGLATRRYTRSGWTRTPFLRRMPHLIRGHFNPAFNIAQSLGRIFRQPGGLFGGIPKDAPVPGGSSASSQGILSSNLPLEDKLSLLMAKLSQHLDKQIEGKMNEIQQAMKGQKKKKGGGLFGKIFGAIGGVAGSMFGGPLGGTIGSALGGALGGAAGGAGRGGGAGGKKQNLQLLQTQLQQLLQKRKQMFQTMGNILKSLHDTSMAAIRNLKA